MTGGKMGKDFEVTKKKEAVPSRALRGYNRCSLRRERDIHVKEGKGIENIYECKGQTGLCV